MLVGTPVYAPTILYSQRRMRSGRSLKTGSSVSPFGTWQPGIYRLIVVLEGRHQVELMDQSFVAEAGQAYLLLPDALRWITVGLGSLAHALGFIVVRTPGSELIPEQGHAYRLRDTAHRQPDPVTVWGRSIGAQLPAAMTKRIRPDVAQAVAIAWRDPWQRAEADQLLGRILWTIASMSQPVPPTTHTDTQSLPQVIAVPWLEGLEGTIDQRLADLRTTSDLAQMVGVSTDHFARVFSRVYGCRPATYLRQRRLQEVARYLQHTDYHLAQIASLVGFRDATALAHAWKNAHDTAPGCWRRKYRLNPVEISHRIR